MVDVVHVTAEMAPIAKVGGLADVVYGLSRACVDLGHRVQVVMPNYDCLKREYLKDLQQKDGFCTATFEGIELVLIDDPAFERGKIWGCDDDVSRFLIFCQKANKVIPNGAVIHLHDWASCPMLFFQREEKCLLTIHNLAHQGIGKWEEIKDLYPMLKPKNYNLLQEGIIRADAITTVSPTYAKEIQTEEFGCGLDGLLREHQGKLTGILNGIDTTYWQPKEKLSFAQKGKLLIGSVGRLTAQKGLPLIRSTIDFAIDNQCQFVLLGTGTEEKINREFDKLAKTYASHPDIHLFITYSDALAHQIYATADLIIVPSQFEPCGLTQLIAQTNGALPVVRKTGGLADTVKDGIDGFVFEEATIQAFHATLNRALDIWRNQPEKWQSLQQKARSHEWSWSSAATAYLNLYQALSTTPKESRMPS